MLGYLKTVRGRLGKTLIRSLAMIACSVFAFGGINTAKATALPIDYLTVDTALANGESLGAGYDITVEAAVTEFLGTGNGLFAAFRFSNPDDITQGGSDSTTSGAQARIHEIYFESGLETFIDSEVVFRSDEFITPPVFDGRKLRPNLPPGIDPAWTGNTYLWFDEGNGASGVGEGDFFEVVFALAAGQSFDTNYLLHDILGNGDIPARIAMHVGDCDNQNSCVVDTWPPPSVIPLPAALPLYGTGLAIMGLIGWRRRRKALAA